MSLSHYRIKKLLIYYPVFIVFSPYTVEILGFCPRLRNVHCMTLVLIFVANFSLPDEEGTPFQEILYVELAKDEAKEVMDLTTRSAFSIC
jgi:hypothetical protein